MDVRVQGLVKFYMRREIGNLMDDLRRDASGLNSAKQPGPYLRVMVLSRVGGTAVCVGSCSG